MITMDANPPFVPPVGPTQAASPSRSWEVMCHLSALVAWLGMPFGNLIGPFVVWIIKRGDSPSIDAHGREVLNFQLSWTLYIFAFAAMTVVLMFILIGFLMLPFLIAACLIGPVISLILSIIGAVKAGNGELFHYPLTIRFLR